MSSLKRILASRANGAKSHGPKTPEGKRVSSMNALRRDSVAGTPVVRTESAARYEDILDAYLREYTPWTHTQLHLVERMANAHWNGQRCTDIQAAALNLELQLRAPEHDKRFRKLDKVTRTALAYQSLESQSQTLSRMARSESRWAREYERFLTLLLGLQAREIKNSANEPTTFLESTEPAPEPVENEPPLLRIEPKAA